MTTHTVFSQSFCLVLMLEVGSLLHSNFCTSHEVPLKCEYLSTEGRTSFGILTSLHQTKVKNNAFPLFSSFSDFCFEAFKERKPTYIHFFSLLAPLVVCAWIRFVLK